MGHVADGGDAVAVRDAHIAAMGETQLDDLRLAPHHGILERRTAIAVAAIGIRAASKDGSEYVGGEVVDRDVVQRRPTRHVRDVDGRAVLEEEADDVSVFYGHSRWTFGHALGSKDGYGDIAPLEASLGTTEIGLITFIYLPRA